MRCNRIVFVVLITFLVAGVVPAQAVDIEQRIAACFPKAPIGYSEDEVDIEPGLAGSLLDYLQSGKVVDKSYEDNQGRMLMIEIVGSRLESYKYALAGQNPGCEIVEVFGHKGVIMYDTTLVIMVADKVVVTFDGADDFSKDKVIVMELVKGFNFNSLEKLLH